MINQSSLTGFRKIIMKYDIERGWLETRYIADLARVEDIASEVGCTVANIKRLLKKWKILRGKALQKEGLVPVWNKGLTKHDDERLMAIANARFGAGNPMAGREAWNKGLTKDMDERVAAISEAMMGNSPSEETRRKMSEAKIGITDMWANRWKGGQSRCGRYSINNVYGRYKYEHRVVTEGCLGRKLHRCEQVHHMDKNPKNNSLANLLVLAIDDHSKLHSAMREDPELNQRAWLNENNIHFEDLEYEDSKRQAA